MVGRFKQALLEKGKMPKKFSVKSGDKSAKGGLTAKGVKRYRAANPGSKLKTAVTTKPSKLKKGSKSAKRRKSFCARMGGMKKRMTSAKTARDPDSRINKALRKWNCSTDANPNTLQKMSEMLAEKCWVGWTQKGLKKKGNKMVPNCVREGDDPRMKTTPSSIQQAGGDPKAYKDLKAEKDPKPAKKEKKKPSRRATLGRKDTPPGPNHPRYLKDKLYKRGVKPKGYGKEGESKEGLSTSQVNQMGVRGQEKKIAKKKSNMRLKMMKDILKARKAKEAKGKKKKLGPGTLATIAQRAKESEK